MNTLPTGVRGSRRIIASTCAVLLIEVSTSAEAVDWDRIEGETVKAFYPGVASLEFTRSADHGTGAAAVKSMKKACADCHVGESGEYDIASDQIATGELKKSGSKQPFEPSPVVGMPALKNVQIKAAYDAESLYLWLRWPSAGAGASDAAAAKTGKSDRISIQVSNNVPSFANFGCFIACHDNQAGMPKGGGSDVRMYGYYTRAQGAVKPQAELDLYRTKGQFMDLWEVYFEGAKPKAKDLYVLQDRLEDNNDLSVTGDFAGGAYTVVVKRKLATGDAQDIALPAGAVFNIALAIHEAGNDGRKHHVTFPVSVGPPGQANVVASKL